MSMSTFTLHKCFCTLICYYLCFVSSERNANVPKRRNCIMQRCLIFAVHFVNFLSDNATSPLLQVMMLNIIMPTYHRLGVQQLLEVTYILVSRWWHKRGPSVQPFETLLNNYNSGIWNLVRRLSNCIKKLWACPFNIKATSKLQMLIWYYWNKIIWTLKLHQTYSCHIDINLISLE